MNAKEEREFIDQCPAWARKAGITNLSQWQIAETIVSYAWPDRFDKLDELRYVLVKVLQKWDSLVP